MSMDLFDQIGKRVSQGLDRAKFEAEKFQKTARIQGEVSNIKHMLDSKMIELGQRAYELSRAGHISSQTIAELAEAVDELRARLIAKEEELKTAQADNYVAPDPPPAPSAQTTPGHQAAASASAQSAQTPPPEATRACSNCGFQMPGRAVFCPNCGYRATPQDTGTDTSQNP